MATDKKIIYHIRTSNKRETMQQVWDVVGGKLAAQEYVVVEVRDPKRSDEQNAKMHAMLSDIAQQMTWQGNKLDVDGWKSLFVSGHAIATRLPHKVVIGIEGELVNVREPTSEMSVRRCASLIEYIQAWAAENGVKFSAEKRYWEQ